MSALVPAEVDRLALAKVRGLSHLAVGVRDLARSAAFYAEVLGFTIFRDESADRRAPRLFGLVGGVTLELVQTPVDAPSPPAGLRTGPLGMAFSVSNLDEACAALHAAGRVRVAIPKTIPGARLLYVADPDGNAFELIEFANGAASPAG